MSAKRRKGDAAGEVWGWGSGGGRQQVPPHCWVWGQRHRKRKRRRVRGPWQGSRSWRLSVHIAFQLSAHSGHGHTSFALTSRMRTSHPPAPTTPFSSFHPAPLAFVFQKWLHNSPKRDVSGLICQSKWKRLWSHNQWEVFEPLFFFSQQCNVSFSFSSKIIIIIITPERSLSDLCVIFLLICLCQILNCSCFHCDRCFPLTEQTFGSFQVVNFFLSFVFLNFCTAFNFVASETAFFF